MENRKSFFEYLGIAHRERIHSQFLAWIISPDCFAIDQKEKEKLLKSLFRLTHDSSIERIHTEWNNADILIETDKEVIIVENKMKSSQHSDQLNRYKECCEKEFPNTDKLYYFLTLIGEKANDAEWEGISYDHIYSGLSSLPLKAGECHSVIIEEYMRYLKRLTEVLKDFIQNVKDYDMVFKDGKRKKKDKINFDYNNENESFIAFNQFETILQKSYLALLAGKVQTATGIISDTRGDALVNFIIEPGIDYAGKVFDTIIQLQQDTIKFAFAIRDDYSKSEKAWIQNMIPVMKLLSTTNTFGYHKCNEPKNKAYVSISKRLQQHYWHMTLDDLARFIDKEIRHGKLLSKKLLRQLSID